MIAKLKPIDMFKNGLIMIIWVNNPLRMILFRMGQIMVLLLNMLVMITYFHNYAWECSTVSHQYLLTLLLHNPIIY